jgi:hypothetical protein
MNSACRQEAPVPLSREARTALRRADSDRRAAPDGTRLQPESEAEPHGQQEHRADHDHDRAQQGRAAPVVNRVPDHVRPPEAIRLGSGSCFLVTA